MSSQTMREGDQMCSVPSSLVGFIFLRKKAFLWGTIHSLVFVLTQEIPS